MSNIHDTGSVITRWNLKFFTYMTKYKVIFLTGLRDFLPDVSGRSRNVIFTQSPWLIIWYCIISFQNVRRIVSFVCGT